MPQTRSSPRSTREAVVCIRFDEPPLSSPGENKKNAETAIRTIATMATTISAMRWPLPSGFFSSGAAAGALGSDASIARRLLVDFSTDEFLLSSDTTIIPYI